MQNEFLIEKVLTRLLNEELVNIKRFKGEEQMYDVQFDRAGNIAGQPVQADERSDAIQDDRFLRYRQLRAAYPRTFDHFFGRIPQAELVNFLNSTNREILRVPPSPGNMAKLFESDLWRDTFDWQKPSDVGKGEQQLRIAFQALDERGRVDFPTEWGGVSVKYVGGGGDSVRSGEKSAAVRKAIVEFKKALLNGRRLRGPFVSVKPDIVERMIDESLTKSATEVDARGRTAVSQDVVDGFFTNLTVALDSLKFAVASEHGASGIIFVSDFQSKYLPSAAAPRKLRMRSITSENRVSFYAPESMGGPNVSTFEGAIEKKRAEWTRANV